MKQLSATDVGMMKKQAQSLIGLDYQSLIPMQNNLLWDKGIFTIIQQTDGLFNAALWHAR